MDLADNRFHDGFAAQRPASPADCHENRPTKRNHVFERKNAAKRNVANRPLQALFGAIFAEQLWIYGLPYELERSETGGAGLLFVTLGFLGLGLGHFSAPLFMMVRTLPRAYSIINLSVLLRANPSSLP